MAVRSTMADLIAAVRLLTNDPATPTPLFPDQAYQDALDQTRQDVNYLELAGRQTINPGGGVVWLDYYAESGGVGIGDWEADAKLQGYPSFAVLSPITSDYLVGHWTFDTSVYASGQRPPVYLIGKTYDRYYAAATILKAWLSQMKLQVADIRTADQSISYHQRHQAIQDVIGQYLAQARVGQLQMTRSDTPAGLWQRSGAFDATRTTF